MYIKGFQVDDEMAGIVYVYLDPPDIRLPRGGSAVARRFQKASPRFLWLALSFRQGTRARLPLHPPSFFQTRLSFEILTPSHYFNLTT